MAHAGGRGELQNLLRAIAAIKILYQSRVVSRIFSSTDPFPEGGSRASRRRRRRRWRQHQETVDSLAARILESYLGRPAAAVELALPDLQELHLAADEGSRDPARTNI
ncbi:rev protein [Simian immunodeficiency virus]|uniref:Protein Rev n=1 Tax=Simian immunodeficiency virus TaxID=11723 RepID=D5G2S0_SIV|nr:rev protein [Simian immunodeficiency virus]